MAGKPPGGLLHGARASGARQYIQGEATSNGDETIISEPDYSGEVRGTGEQYVVTPDELFWLRGFAVCVGSFSFLGSCFAW